MPAERKPGMDHNHHEWSPMATRGVLRWPQDARVALCVIVSLEHMEWDPPPEAFQSSGLAGGSVPRPFPDYARISHREYGHRVGIFRVLDVLEKHGIRPTVAMDAMTAEYYPYLVRHCLDRGCEIISRGISISRMITSDMTEDEERKYIQTSLDTLQQATGSVPSGWFGPEYGESHRTPQLLAEAGLTYVCDWANDEQPYLMTTSSGELYALPTMWELDDVNALANRKVVVSRYAGLLKDGFDAMHQDGEANGRAMVLNLHPWLIGQPFRIGYLDGAFRYMMERGGVWPASGLEIIDWYKKNPPVNRG